MNAIARATSTVSISEQQREDHFLRKVEEIWGEVLEATDLSEFVQKDSEHPVSAGAFGDIFRGTYYPNLRKNSMKRMWRSLSQPSMDKPIPVSIKVVRPILTEGSHQEASRNHLAKEIAIWQRLHHENIMPFLGVSYKFGPLPSPIAAWQANGAVQMYLEAFPNANRYEIIRGIANGLKFLHGHTPQIVHGDLKPGNILVSDWGTPFLTDFGIAAVNYDKEIWKPNATHATGTKLYMSPELLSCKQIKSTTASDVYAFAMTCCVLLSVRRPFDIANEATIVVAVAMDNKRPERPENTDIINITNELWAVIEKCWATDPVDRPPVQDVEGGVVLSVGHKIDSRLDGGGISALSSLITLEALMNETALAAKPCDYFDMIAGSEAGGLIALMLGRLRMTVHDCIEEFRDALKELFNTPIEKQRKRIPETPRFGSFTKISHRSVYGKIVNERVEKNERDMYDKRPDLCRTFVIAKHEGNQGESRLRTYPVSRQATPSLRIRLGMESTMSTPLNFEAATEENVSFSKYNNPDVQTFSPSEQLLDEARKFFGDHRSIGCLVSLGNGISTQAFGVDKEFSTQLPEALVNDLRHCALAINDVHGRMPNSLEPGSYFRFDPAHVVQERIQDADQWRELFAWQRAERMDDMQGITMAYLERNDVMDQLKRCAEKLRCRRQLDVQLRDGYRPEYFYPKHVPCSENFTSKYGQRMEAGEDPSARGEMDEQVSPKTEREVMIGDAIPSSEDSQSKDRPFVE